MREHRLSCSLVLHLVSLLTIFAHQQAMAEGDNFTDISASPGHHDETNTTLSPLTELRVNQTRNLSETDLFDCLKLNATLNVTLEQTSMSVSLTDNVSTPLGVCLLIVTTSAESVLHVHFVEQSCVTGNSVLVYDEEDDEDWHGCETVFDPLSDFTSSGTTVHIQITLGDVSRPYSLRMAVAALTTPVKPELEVRYMTKTHGYVQTPGWNPQKYRSFPGFMDSWVKVTVPEDHMIMISFYFLQLYVSFFDGCGDVVRIYKGGNSSDDLVWSGCGTVRPVPMVVDSDVMHVHFTSDYVDDKWLGFRLLFSFHQDFEVHFSCNLETECQDGEDEAPCPYTDSACGQGRISVGGSCYVWRRPEKTMTWNDANLECVSLGGYLASLNTPEEFRAFDDVMDKQRTSVVIGLRTTSSKLPHMYKYALQWTDKTVAYLSRYYYMKEPPACTYVDRVVSKTATALTFNCVADYDMYYLCEVSPLQDRAEDNQAIDQPGIQLPRLSDLTMSISTVECPAGHVTHAFLACDVDSDCWAVVYESGEEPWDVPSVLTCPAPLTSLPPHFPCRDGVERVPYSLVCDHRQDCQDASDEDFCVFRPCTGSTSLQCGNTAQCVPVSAWCDGQPHCVDGSDEVHCDRWDLQFDVDNPPPPAVVQFDGRGSFTVTPLSGVPQNGSALCPETHFQCPGNGYCLPVYVRCNGVYDCSRKEDEAACDRYECPGYYRCRGSRVCLHPSHVCDGVSQCPGQDDEMACDVDCPQGCTCHGFAFFCVSKFDVSRHKELRYLHAADTGLGTADLRDNLMLIHVSLARCGLMQLDTLTLPNLHSLDLSDNELRLISMEQLSGLPSLRVLDLSGNPLISLFLDVTTSTALFPSLVSLDLSRVKIEVLNSDILTPFHNLDSLSLQDSGVHTVHGDGFQAAGKLRILDVRGCGMSEFPRTMLKSLNRLQTVYADNYKLCCPAMLPAGFNLQNCRAPEAEISSCDNLLGPMSYRVFTAVVASLALTGNFASFIVRVVVRKSGLNTGSGVLVTHLSVSDFLMGVYLAIIAVTDSVYRDIYLWEDPSWRQSATCRLAGFLFLFSTEVSACIIVFITLSQILVLRFPRYTRLHLQKTSAHVGCVVILVFGLMLALVPIMMTSWDFYNQTGICIPLPITMKAFEDQGYAFGVMVIFTFTLGLLVAVGQGFIYASVRNSDVISAEKTSQDQHKETARQTMPLAVVNVIRWFVLGLLGILASTGSFLPVVARVDVSLFLLLIHSALNPVLHVLGVARERRRKAWEERLLKLITAKVKASQAKMKVSRGPSSQKQ